MITIAQIIDRIEQRQPVLNKSELSDTLTDVINSVSSLTHAQSGQLSFLSNPHYASSLARTQAGAVLLTPQMRDQLPDDSVAIVVAQPYLAYASASHLFERKQPEAHIHPSASIDPSAMIADGVSIGAFCVIGEGVQIGAGSMLYAHVVIEDGAQIGEQVRIDAHVSIGAFCMIGNHSRIHAGASIGSEGFGFAPTRDPSTEGWERIVQLGRVIIGDHVRIGANTCVDRGAIDDTVIGNHVIIDNLVQIAHNVTIGDGSAIAAKTGIAGSTTIGKRCIIGGAVGINGHIDICDDVTLSGMTMVTKSIKKSGSYSSGTVAMPTQQWRKAAVRFRQLANAPKSDGCQ